MNQISKILKKTFSDTVQLSGHKSEIYSGKFSKDGELYATGGNDKEINIWETFHSQLRNLTSFPNAHSNSILEICWGKGNTFLYSCSADKSLKIWDIFESKLVKKYKNHDNFIYSLDVFNDKLICSVGEDSKLILNDPRSKSPTHEEKFKFQLLTTKFNHKGDEIYIGGIDNQIKKFNIKTNTIDKDYTLIGHTDTVTGISISNNDNYLLSNSMDNTLCIWDLRPFVRGGNRLVKVLRGHVHSFERNLLRCAWSYDDNLVSCGSADRCVHIWDVDTGELLYNLYGHNGSVNEVDFNSANSEIIGSVSSDHTAIIGKYNI